MDPLRNPAGAEVTVNPLYGTYGVVPLVAGSQLVRTRSYPVGDTDANPAPRRGRAHAEGQLVGRARHVALRMRGSLQILRRPQANREGIDDGRSEATGWINARRKWIDG